MSKILAVFGATGQQGSSVISHILHDVELFRAYTIRAITRDPTSPKAAQLASNVEVVQAEVHDHASLSTALAGVHTVFIMTTPSFTPTGLEDEFGTGKLIADTAVAQGVQYIIFSTLPAVREISGGKYNRVTPFDAKAKIEAYVRSLDIKSAFVSLGSFMENFQSQPFLAPKKMGDEWVISLPNEPAARWPLLDAVGDTGKFVGAILAEPEKFEGMTFHAATMLYSLEEVAATLAKKTGKKVVYRQIEQEEFVRRLPFQGVLADIFVDGYGFYEEFGYFGPDTEGLVKWAAENARGRLSTFEEFLEKHPFQLA